MQHSDEFRPDEIAPSRRPESLTPDEPRGVLGARNLNQVLQTALNPSVGGPEVERFGWTYRIGDRVIQTENDYDKDVLNGDLGVVEKSTGSSKRWW